MARTFKRLVTAPAKWSVLAYILLLPSAKACIGTVYFEGWFCLQIELTQWCGPRTFSAAGARGQFRINTWGQHPLNSGWISSQPWIQFPPIFPVPPGAALTGLVVVLPNAGPERQAIVSLVCGGVVTYRVIIEQQSGLPPVPPTGVAASDGTFTDRVRLTWSGSIGATSYEVWRSTNSNSSTSIKIPNPDPTGQVMTISAPATGRSIGIG